MKSRRSFLLGAGAGLSALFMPGSAKAWGRRRKGRECTCNTCRGTYGDGTCFSACPASYIGQTNGVYYYNAFCCDSGPPYDPCLAATTTYITPPYDTCTPGGECVGAGFDREHGCGTCVSPISRVVMRVGVTPPLPLVYRGELLRYGVSPPDLLGTPVSHNMEFIDANSVSVTPEEIQYVDVDDNNVNKYWKVRGYVIASASHIYAGHRNLKGQATPFTDSTGAQLEIYNLISKHGRTVILQSQNGADFYYVLMPRRSPSA